MEVLQVPEGVDSSWILLKLTRGQLEHYHTIDIGKAIHNLESKDISITCFHIFALQSKPKCLPKDCID